MGEFTVSFLISILPRLPVLLVYLVGVGLAIAQAKKLRGAAIFAGAGFGLLTLSALIGFGSQYWVMIAARDNSVATLTPVLALSGLVTTVMTIVGLVLLMFAIFARRAAPAGPPGGQ